MFAHIFTYRLKCLLRNHMTIFWTLLFPILLALFFSLSLRNLATAEDFHPVPVAVVNDAAYQNDTNFRTALKSVSEGKGHIFALTETTKENAAKLLADGNVDGVLTAGDKIGLTVNKSGLNVSIIQTFAESYMQTNSAVSSVLKENPAAMQKLAENLKTQTEYLKEKPISDAKPDNSLAYFYSLVAMACMYGCFWGMREITDIQADLSQRAVRVNLAPVHKLKTFLYSMAASLTVDFAEILIQLAFLRYCLGIDFGPKTGFVVFTSFVGCLVGLSAGAFIGAIVKSNENLKVGILLTFFMSGCVLSGMMYQGLKTVVQQNAPLVNYLNPVALVSDAFYCLYYYSGYERYWLNIGLLGAFAVVFCAVTYFIIRRRKYASL